MLKTLTQNNCELCQVVSHSEVRDNGQTIHNERTDQQSIASCPGSQPQ